MAKTLAVLKTQIKTNIAADLATPVIDDLDDTSISTWANKLVNGIVDELLDPVHYPSLVVFDYALSVSSNASTLPTDFLKLIWQGHPQKEAGVKVTTSKLRCRILSVDNFNRLDSKNFLTTPNTYFPVACVQDKVRYKGTTYTAAYLDYIKKHQDIASGTQFDDIGDTVLIHRIMAEYFDFIGQPELGEKHRNLAREIVANANSKVSI